MFPHWQVLTWMLLIVGVKVARMAWQRFFGRAQHEPGAMESWRRAFMIGVASTAALWGAAMWVFFNTTEILPRFYMIVCGMNAGAVRSLASVPAATVVYVVFTMSPLTVRYLQINEPGNMAMVFLTIAFGQVESEPGAGSCFSFELPLPLAAPPPEVTHSPFGDATMPLPGRVLVVEDDRVNQMVIRLMIKNMGLTCEIVADGAAAVDRAVGENWNLVLMDVQMSGIDGMEATRRIRAHPAGGKLPIIALTANAMAEDRAACASAGMSSFLAKPVKESELRACVEQWLRLR